MTWFKDLDVPETFGFLKNQVTPFSIKTADNEHLYAWHVLPIELYRKNELALTAEQTGFVRDITSRLAFRLLRDDPEARLVVHMHGAGGTVASGYRVPNYRALSAGHPGKIHVLTFDYRGFGRSKGKPSEAGLNMDALTVTQWAINVAGIPASRIRAVDGDCSSSCCLSPFRVTCLHIALRELFRYYRLFGDSLRDYLLRFIRDKWLTNEHITGMVRMNEANEEKYRLNIIHAEDDWDIPSHHSELLFWHAVNGSVPVGITYEELEQSKAETQIDLGAAGTIMEWRTEYGVIREEILKSGLHDVVMGYPIVSMSVMRHFEATDPSFTV